MAARNTTQAAPAASVSLYSTFAFSCAYDATKLASSVRAARALLEQFDAWDSSNDLTALHVVLQGIERQAQEMRDRISASHNDFASSQVVQS